MLYNPCIYSSNSRDKGYEVVFGCNFLVTSFTFSATENWSSQTQSDPDKLDWVKLESVVESSHSYLTGMYFSDPVSQMRYRVPLQS
jgi:hypothetical protein